MKKIKKVTISACLAGHNCRYNAEIKKNPEIMQKLKDKDWKIIPFCPEDACFGTPREAIDLIQIDNNIKAVTKFSKEDRTKPIIDCILNFFSKNKDIDLFIGKARSPSCGVCTARLYDEKWNLISDKENGILAAEAKARGIRVIDDENLDSILQTN